MYRFLPLALLLAAGTAHAQPAGVGAGPWQLQLQGGAVHQFESGLDGGGDFSVNRLFIEGGVAYALDRRRSVGVAVAYGYDDFDFSGTTRLGESPWGSVNEYRLSTPVRWGFGERFDAVAVPSVRWTAESGADLGDSLNGGVITGFTYKFGDHLRIGPGVGAFTQLDDDVAVFPILFIDWQVIEDVSVATGAGLGATRGPGLTVNWTGLERWTFTLGARYESFQFRLDDGGVAPDGVGEEKAIPVFLSAGFDPIPNVRLAAVGGVDVGGQLELKDSSGRELSSADFDPAPFLGFTFRARF